MFQNNGPTFQIEDSDVYIEFVSLNYVNGVCWCLVKSSKCASNPPMMAGISNKRRSTPHIAIAIAIASDSKQPKKGNIATDIFIAIG